MLKIETFTQVDVDEVDGVPLDVDGVPLAKDVDGEPLADEEEEDIFNMSPKKSFVSLEFKEVPIVFTLITLNLCRVLSLEVHHTCILCALFKRTVHFLKQIRVNFNTLQFTCIF